MERRPGVTDSRSNIDGRAQPNGIHRIYRQNARVRPLPSPHTPREFVNRYLQGTPDVRAIFKLGRAQQQRTDLLPPTPANRQIRGVRTCRYPLR